MVSRREALRLSGTALTAIAGCTGQRGGPGAEETPGVPEERVINYDELAPEEQNAFDQARNETVIFSSSLSDDAEVDVDFGISVAQPFQNHDSVRKDGTLYELQMNGPHRIGATRVEVGPVGSRGNGTVISLENRTGEGYELVRQAIEADGVTEGIQVQQPDSVSTGDVVEYRGNYYEVTHLSHRDYGYFELTVANRA